MDGLSGLKSHIFLLKKNPESNSTCVPNYCSYSMTYYVIDLHYGMCGIIHTEWKAYPRSILNPTCTCCYKHNTLLVLLPTKLLTWKFIIQEREENPWIHQWREDSIGFWHYLWLVDWGVFLEYIISVASAEERGQSGNASLRIV